MTTFEAPILTAGEIARAIRATRPRTDIGLSWNAWHQVAIALADELADTHGWTELQYNEWLCSAGFAQRMVEEARWYQFMGKRLSARRP